MSSAELRRFHLPLSERVSVGRIYVWDVHEIELLCILMEGTFLWNEVDVAVE